MAACSEHSIAIHSISKADCLTAVLAIVCAQNESSLCDFFNDLLQFHLILLLFFLLNQDFFQMGLIMSTIANLFPIMIHFNSLDFYEWGSKKWLVSFDTQCIYIIGLQHSSLEGDGCMELVPLAPGKDFGNEW